MSATDQARADAAIDAYTDRFRRGIDEAKQVSLGGQDYTIFGYKADPSTGFHATAYQNSNPPHNIIIAYRGTDPDILHHPITTIQDVVADYVMVRDQVNVQKKAADEFTQAMLDKAEKLGIPRDQVTVTGHSLGGALAEIEASQFKLRGSTINGYGAVDLIHGVPEGGNQVINYVLAGDPVSAASRHYGTVVPFASPEDVQGLKTGRYLDAPGGVSPPNPLMAMRLSDHGGAHFTGPNSVLSPDKMARYEKNYTDNKAAFNQFRRDMYSDREALGIALRDPHSNTILATWANLPSAVQQHLAEYHAHVLDRPIRDAVTHNPVVESVKQKLDLSSATLIDAGHGVLQGYEQFAQHAEAARKHARRQANAMAEGVLAAPLDPITLSGAMGTKAAGFVLGTGADGLAQASRITGKVTEVATQAAASGTEMAKHAVEQHADVASRVVTGAIHVGEIAAAMQADALMTSYQQAKATSQMISDGVSQAYEATKGLASRSVDAAGHAIDTLTHPSQWFGHTPPASATKAAVPTERSSAHSDPRHPDGPNHALYNQLHERIPEAGENRLLQFTAACHANGITDKNLKHIHFDQVQGVMAFGSGGLVAHVASVNLKAPVPTPEQSMQRIQQFDQQQAQLQTHVRAPNQQETKHGPMPGGR